MAEIRLFNTLTRQKEPFVPVRSGQVRMYVCGPTVYNDLHIGNFRCFVVFETLARFLRSEGYAVTRVQNFTDVDDKMIHRAREAGVSLETLAGTYTSRYFEDARRLYIEDADVHPAATAHIPDIIHLIGTLLEKGMAYEVEGDVYYDTTRFPGYGKLSGQTAAERMAGARIEVDPRKRNPADFALWKATKPGEPAWPSPWGEGRPGWHIECSAMSERYLGETFDIHAGGQDLIFPHHENEIAQSEGAHDGHPMARFWLHNGLLTTREGKMSKSLGNVALVGDLLKRYPAGALRLYLLSAHYRHPLEFTGDLLEAQAAAFQRLMAFRRRLVGERGSAGGGDALAASGREALARFREALRDDFNTIDALSALYEWVRKGNQILESSASDPAAVDEGRSLLDDMLGVLGLLPPDEEGLSPEEEDLLERRRKAREERNWAESDRIRDLLLQRGIRVEDTPQGMRWHRG